MYEDFLEIVDLDELMKEKLNIINNDFSIKNGVLLSFNNKNNKVVVPEGVFRVGMMTSGYDFDDCNDEECDLNNNVRELILPSTVRVIGSNFLNGFDGLNKITLSDNVKKIGECAFCTSVVGGMFCSKLPSEIVINYDNYNSLELLIDKMIESNSFNFMDGNVCKYQITLVGPILNKIEILKLSKRFIKMRVNKVKYVDVLDKFNNTNALIECLNIVNNKTLPSGNRDVSKILSHSELVKVKFKEINKVILELNLSDEEEKKYRTYLIDIIKSALRDLGNNEYNPYKMQNKVFDINIKLIDMKTPSLFDNTKIIDCINKVFSKIRRK